MKRLIALAASGLFVLLHGCTLAYMIRLTMITAETELDGPRVDEAVAAVTEVAEIFQLRPNPNLEQYFRLKERSAESDGDGPAYEIIAQFVPGPALGARSWEGRLTVSAEKQRGRLAVTILELQALHATPFTAALEEAIREALQARFPSAQIDIERQRGPLFFGP